jgi:hypothetical protein
MELLGESLMLGLGDGSGLFGGLGPFFSAFRLRRIVEEHADSRLVIYKKLM